MLHHALWVSSLVLVSACHTPSPDHRLNELGLQVTLPPDWRGGKITGAGYVFTSGAADATLSVLDDVRGLSVSEPGLRDFLEQRVGGKVESTGAHRFGATPGFVAVGSSGPGTREYVGGFTGPRGPVWVHFTTRRRAAADAEAQWKALTASLRP